MRLPRSANAIGVVDEYGRGLHLVRLHFSVEPGRTGVGFVGTYSPSVTAVRSMQRRVAEALRAEGFAWPDGFVRIASDPEVRELDPTLDLAIAIGLLRASGQAVLGMPESVAYVGELGGGGVIRLPWVSIGDIEKLGDRYHLADVVAGNGRLTIGQLVHCVKTAA